MQRVYDHNRRGDLPCADLERNSQGVNEQCRAEPLVPVVVVDSEATDQDRGHERIPGKRAPRLQWQALEMDGGGAQGVVTGDALVMAVVEHEDLGDVPLVVRSCPLAQVGVEGFLTARESRAVMVARESLDAEAECRHHLLGNKIPVPTRGGTQPLVGLRRVRQRFRKRHAVARSERH